MTGKHYRRNSGESPKVNKKSKNKNSVCLIRPGNQKGSGGVGAGGGEPEWGHQDMPATTVIWSIAQGRRDNEENRIDMTARQKQLWLEIKTGCFLKQD